MKIFAQDTATSELELLSPHTQIKNEIAQKINEIMEHRKVLEQFEKANNMPQNGTVKFLDVVSALKPIITLNEECLRLIRKVKNAANSHIQSGIQSKQNLEKISQMLINTKKELKKFRKLIVESAADPASDKGLQSALMVLDPFINKDHQKPYNKNVFLDELEAVEKSLLNCQRAYTLHFTDFTRASEREGRINDLNLECHNLRKKLNQPSTAGSPQAFLRAPTHAHKRKPSLENLASLCNLL